MEDVRLPFIAQPLDGMRQGTDLAPLADCGQAAGDTRGAVKDDAVGFLSMRPSGQMALPGDAAHLQPGRSLRFQYRAGAESVAAVERQGVIEDMQHLGHRQFF